MSYGEISAVFAPILLAVVIYFLYRSKTKAEVEGIKIKNVQLVIETFETIVDNLNKSVFDLTKQYAKEKAKNNQLNKIVSELNDTINILENTIKELKK